MKVLVVTNMWPSEDDVACGIFVKEQVRSLEKLGVEADVLHVDGRSDTRNYLRAFARYRDRLRSGKYDLVHAHYVLTGIVARSQRKLPLVLTHHGIEVLRGWQAPLSWAMTRLADRTIVASPAMKKRLGLGSVRVIPSGVDMELFRPMSREDARQRLGWPLDRRVVLFVGLPRPEKRIDVVHAAMDRLNAGGSKAHLEVIAGQLPREEIPVYMSAADVLVLTSDGEGSPMVVKEACACDLPVVSVDVGDVAEIIGSIPGCAICERSAEDVAEKLGGVLTRRARTDGRARVRHLRRESIARKVLDVYEEALRDHPPRRVRVSPTEVSLGRAPRPTGDGRSVCVVRHAYYPADPRVQREVRALREAGYRVDIICLRKKGEPFREKTDEVGVFRMPVGHRRGERTRYCVEYGAFFVWASLTLNLRFLMRPFSLLQVNTMPEFLVFTGLLPWVAGVRILVDMQDLMPELYASKFGVDMSHGFVRFLTLVERLSMRFADHVLTVSEPCRQVFLDRGVPARKLSIMLNVADDRRFCHEMYEPRPICPGDPVTLICHGTLVERYGFDVLIEATDRVRKEQPGICLRIVGDGEYGTVLRRMVEERGLRQHVIFDGHQPLEKIPGILSRADIGIVANRPDVFTDLVLPMKLLEYVSMRVPAVVGRSGAIGHYFDEESVTFYEAGCPRDLARAILEVVDDLAAAREMAERAWTRFHGAHPWDRARCDYLRLVDRLCG